MIVAIGDKGIIIVFAGAASVAGSECQHCIRQRRVCPCSQRDMMGKMSLGVTEVEKARAVVDEISHQLCCLPTISKR